MGLAWWGGPGRLAYFCEVPQGSACFLAERCLVKTIPEWQLCRRGRVRLQRLHRWRMRLGGVGGYFAVLFGLASRDNACKRRMEGGRWR